MTPVPSAGVDRVHDYRVYGVVLRSALPLACVPAEPAAEPDMQARFVGSDALVPPDVPPSWADPRLDASGRPALRLWRHRSESFLEYADGSRFRIDERAAEITCGTPTGESNENTRVYLLGQVLAYALRLRGTVVLHGSAAVIDGRAVVFLGEPGAGKSTTVASLARRGFPLLTDDLVAIRQHDLAVHPGYTGAKLWPDAAAALGAEAAEPILPRSTYWRGWDKRFLDLRGATFAGDPHPLGAVFLLEATAPAAPTAERLHGHQALVALLAHVSLGYLPGEAPRRREMVVLSRSASVVPVIRLRSGEGLGRLEANLDLILAHLHEAA